MKFASALALLASAATVALAGPVLLDERAPPTVTITALDPNSDCFPGTSGVVASTGPTSGAIFFDNYNVTVPERFGIVREKWCNIIFTIILPGGCTELTFDLNYDGQATLSSGVTGFFHTDYSPIRSPSPGDLTINPNPNPNWNKHDVITARFTNPPASQGFKTFRAGTRLRLQQSGPSSPSGTAVLNVLRYSITNQAQC
jgi:hypothetical protein